MGIDKNAFKSKSGEYETPNEIVEPLKKEFDLELDVCATRENTKCEFFFTKEDDAFSKEWNKNFWMNPPFSKDLKKWVQRAYKQSLKHKVIGVLILPVRSNTNWWHKYIIDTKAEVRFLKGETKFVGHKRGLWLPFAIVIFNSQN
jgi:site-specific DNA-methyltransferase (adenine-specific)